ncbi:unnamed protein product [Schistosoma mattheei]|uniref:Uncharacterized protein n=1 Tax=Schistosoma mattheei TaxID=31246 RepID=A0A183NWA4_9TREM|nr:unnamed protein product [Schistosoma mattheei]
MIKSLCEIICTILLTFIKCLLCNKKEFTVRRNLCITVL